ncbi:WWM1 [Candida margitis]|uniref:WWM1 n=1 Tax=Candida margitis TaxID=1775924 RepID=UPI0022265C8B|nr:WWM1 [Candida margitis]KAI5960723.1 WWM1 [Candida margitis]
MAQGDPNKPPTVPSGWLAKFDDKYKTWFYVDLATKKSQWEAPKDTVFDKGDDVPPPAYSPNASKAETASPAPSTSNVPPKDAQGKGLFNRPQQQQPGYGGGVPPQQGYGGYPPQQGYGYPPQGYGGYPPQGYGGYPPQGYGQYPPQQQQQQQQPQRSRFGGGAGNMALGVGGGLLGGMLLGNAINGWEDHERMEGYQDGYQDGYDNGDYGGGDDFGGGDFGGGDF